MLTSVAIHHTYPGRGGKRISAAAKFKSFLLEYFVKAIPKSNLGFWGQHLYDNRSLRTNTSNS